MTTALLLLPLLLLVAVLEKEALPRIISDLPPGRSNLLLPLLRPLRLLQPIEQGTLQTLLLGETDASSAPNAGMYPIKENARIGIPWKSTASL